MKGFKIEMTGKMPYLMSTQVPADGTRPEVQELKALQRMQEQKKTPEIYKKIADIEWDLNLHLKDGQVVIPAMNLKQAIVSVAREEKKGTLVERYVSFDRFYFPLEHEGPKDIKELKADDRFRDTRLANHGKSQGKICMVLQTRPIFYAWKCTAFLLVNDEKIDPKDFERWIHALGRFYGLGAYRDLYGRFDAKVSEVATEGCGRLKAAA